MISLLGLRALNKSRFLFSDALYLLACDFLELQMLGYDFVFVRKVCFTLRYHNKFFDAGLAAINILRVVFHEPSKLVPFNPAKFPICLEQLLGNGKNGNHNFAKDSDWYSALNPKRSRTPLVDHGDLLCPSFGGIAAIPEVGQSVKQPCRPYRLLLDEHLP